MGSKMRTRQITQAAQYGGAVCPGTTEIQVCNAHACPIDCTVNDFGGWSNCDKSCGTGSQGRVRTIDTNHAYGGKACPTTMIQSRKCLGSPCKSCKFKIDQTSRYV